MDSLTQIVLGAACGEVVLGKKAGNRAMLWGGIAGTIPDLDIVANFVTDDMTALAFHRGISHSFFFAVTAPIVFGWLVARFYKSGLYQQKAYKGIAMSIWLLLMGLMAFGVNSVPISMEKGISWPVLAISIGVFALATIALWRKYYQTEFDEINISTKEWAWLFFWAIITHPLLDSCTAYGTQLFQPFSDYRVALNNVSVVDPIYTVPFLICLIIAGLMTRKISKRRLVNYAGIGISSAYLLFTGYNKIKVDRVFENSLAEQNISYNRYTASPTIGNNILWHAVAEGDSAYFHGYYSLLDEQKKVLNFIEISKNHNLLTGHENDRSIKILKWFTDDYYNVTQRPDGHLQLNDMRYGSRSGEFKSNDDYVFKFVLKEEDGVLEGHENREPPKSSEMSGFFKRLKGI
jgi:inner membrane protein